MRHNRYLPALALAAAGLTATAGLADQQVRYAAAPVQSGEVVRIGGMDFLLATNGCSYSRAGSQWRIVVNGARMGLTNARGGCAPALPAGG
ncbi:hypothetical protein [Salibaculum sp.]|uniref:hypothetical protein n=1 Tax=Salibaculum sp. TaxID=2855480 RepID=UPI002B468945|nr:hypothetical protein [Salibaculum sp.]HKL70760.1 hypothetical protein [Salibaculum sp.]